MKTKVTGFWYWYDLSFSYWFVPAIIAIFGTEVACGAHSLDAYFWQENISPGGWVLFGDLSGAQTIFTSVAMSMMHVLSLQQ